MKNIDSRNRFYYSKFKVSLITMAIFLAIMPLNVFLYNTGVYGKNYIDLGFIFKMFLFDSLRYDIIFTVTMIFSFLLFLNSYKTKEHKTFDFYKDKIFSLGLLTFFARAFYPSMPKNS